MKNEIDIREYAPFFHDGSLRNITCTKQEIRMSMCSAEISPEDFLTPVALSKMRTLTGILHCQGVRKIEITGNIKIECFFELFDRGIILDFEYSDHTLEIGILWENFPPKPRTNQFTTILIQADQFFLENIPNLLSDGE